MGAWRVVAAVVLVAGLLAGCRDDGRPDREPEARSPGCVARILDGEQGPGCRTLRVDLPDPRFVPQGVALAGDGTAYLSGYRYERVPGSRECQVARVGLRRGRVLGWAPILYGDVPGVGRQFCRHGGGIALTRHGLFVAGASRLWLVDPDRLEGDPVLRVWRVDDRFRASTATAVGGDLLVGVWRERRRGQVLRYRLADLLEPGAAVLDAAPGGTGVAPRRTRPAPSRLQGVARVAGGDWLARSTSYCGELVTPAGRRLPFLPGAEGIAFDGAGRLVVVSESGSRPYQRMGGRPDVPTISVIDPRRLDRTDRASCW